MTLQKPFDISIRGLIVDAKEDNKITWSISGDIQVSYKVDIYLNSDYSLVHTSNIVQSYNLSYTLPKNTLVNGNEYKIFILAYNSKGESATSLSQIFQTSSRPTVVLDSIGTVSSYSYQFSASYSQSENIELQSWNANLYNAQKELIDHSDIMIDLPMEYLFSNFETETSYYIEFQATSEKGLVGTTGLVKFDVFYLRPKMNVSLTATNIENAGIELSWYVARVLGKANGTISYINNDEVTLANGRYISYDNGFSISRDFSLKIWLRDFASNVPLITLKGDNGQIVVKYNAIQKAFVLTKTSYIFNEQYQSNSTIEYVFISPYQITELTGNKAVLLIQQINNDINLEVTMYN